ncbi:MAG: ATP-binding protein [Planctomycetes bacterium]|nr:ATP-binding protein [Planctomycetota bacterium]MCB9868450.1 ATP-binding protein [Planctomycetota bacterium]
MAFVSGPRQVGKTTTCRAVRRDAHYLDWDDQEDRRLILKGPKAVASALGLAQLREEPPVVVFDELHKHRRWKAFLKGLFDRYKEHARVVVTGSSRLDVYRRGGDSLMGRYLLYRMHPLSIGELLDPRGGDELVRPPRRLSARRFDVLWTHGGYPEPFTKADARFSTRWRQLRVQQLVREDVRDASRIQELGQLEVLATLLESGTARQLVYSKLARDVNISVDTARRWVATLASLHHGFLLRPWFRNVGKALRKEPKWFLRDWSGVRELGQRAETFVACHLLKAAELWTDLGFGDFELRYLRDKSKREIDFVMIRDRQPWFLVEVKVAETALSPHLGHFQQQVGAAHAFQVVLDLPFVAADCFTRSDPCVVPLRTLLSQLP